MARNGGARKRHTLTPNTARGICTEAETVQESMWKFRHHHHRNSNHRRNNNHRHNSHRRTCPPPPPSPQQRTQSRRPKPRPPTARPYQRRWSPRTTPPTTIASFLRLLCCQSNSSLTRTPLSTRLLPTLTRPLQGLLITMACRLSPTLRPISASNQSLTAPVLSLIRITGQCFRRRIKKKRWARTLFFFCCFVDLGFGFFVILFSFGRYFHGTKESMDELAFFPESARGFTDSSSCHPLMGYNRGYSQPQYQALTVTDASKEPIKQSAEDQQHCFILGTDFKSERSNKASVKDQPHETQKPLHHFFGEWPPKNTAADSWLDLASNSRVPNGNFTHCPPKKISIPSAISHSHSFNLRFSIVCVFSLGRWLKG